MSSPRFQHLFHTFRKKYVTSRSAVTQWYPGHMQGALYQIQAKLRSIDCIVEIHDARIPFSGRNLKLREIIKLRPHILLLNKADLIDFENDEVESIKKRLKAQEVDTVFFTDFKTGGHMRFVKSQLLPAAINLVDSNPRYNREGAEDYNILVLGVPNVGKSTFINSARASQLKKVGKATTVGAMAGVTKKVLSKIKVNAHPPVYVFDTPGIMSPKIPGLETGMRLAACACLPDVQVGHVNIADYVLYLLNSRRCFDYVEFFELEAPSDNILDVLSKIAIKNRRIIQRRDVATNRMVYLPDNDQAARLFYTAFREGNLGKFIIDNDL